MAICVNAIWQSGLLTLNLKRIDLINSENNVNLSLFTVSASYVPGAIPDSSRQRHAPLYGRLVSEEHLPAAHHQVNTITRLA